MVPPDSLQLSLRKTKPIAWVLIVASGVLTLGVVPVLLGLLMCLAWLFDTRPALFDREGLTTRKGRRLPWTELVEVEAKTEYRRVAGRPVPVRWFLVLTFRNARIAFQPDVFTDGETALAYLEHCLGRTLERPPWLPPREKPAP